MKFGADNLFKKLRSVLVAKPADYGITSPINIWQEKNVGNINKELALRQHEKMVEALEKEGVKCYFLDPVRGATEQKDTRDIGVISSKGGIVGHFKKNIRMGEVGSFFKFCAENDIEILKYGVPFEGGDFFFIDEKECLIGVGQRTEIRASEIEILLQRKVHLVHHISSHHLDAIFNIVSENLIVAHRGYIAEQEYLVGKDIIELDDSDIWNMSANFLLLEKNRVIADSGCHDFNDKLRAKGVEVVEVDLSELKKNGGSIRCMTLPILRD